MGTYVGLDVSLEETAVCVMDGEGGVRWRGRCLSRPDAMAATLRKQAPEAVRIVLETGPLSTWHWHELRAMDLPVVCVDARRAKKALSMYSAKTDRLDAEGLAQLARTGWYTEVQVKALDSHRLRSALIVRSKLVAMRPFQLRRGLPDSAALSIGRSGRQRPHLPVRRHAAARLPVRSGQRAADSHPPRLRSERLGDQARQTGRPPQGQGRAGPQAGRHPPSLWMGNCSFRWPEQPA